MSVQHTPAGDARGGRVYRVYRVVATYPAVDYEATGNTYTATRRYLTRRAAEARAARWREGYRYETGNMFDEDIYQEPALGVYVEVSDPITWNGETL